MGRDEHPAGELDVFATGTTEFGPAPRAGATPPPGHPDRVEASVVVPVPPPGDLPRFEEISTGVRAGPRPVAVGSPSDTRRATDAYVVRSVLVDPSDALRVSLDGTVFGDRLPKLRIIERDDRGLTWSVVVVGGIGRQIPATLRLLGSRSMAVTLIELVPSGRIRRARRRFVRRGVCAVDELAGRIEHATACAPTARTP